MPHSFDYVHMVNMGATACGGKADLIAMTHSSTNMKVWGDALSPWTTIINWELRNIPWADGWSVGSRYSHNLSVLRFEESPADDKNDLFFSAICTGIHGTKYNCVLQWMLVHRDPKRAAIGPLTKGQSWTDFYVKLTLGTYFSDIYCTLQWRHNGRDVISNHRRLDCVLNGLFRRKSKRTSKLRVTAFVRGIHRWPGNSLHKGSVTQEMFPFDDVIMTCPKSLIFFCGKWLDMMPLYSLSLLCHFTDSILASNYVYVSSSISSYRVTVRKWYDIVKT